MADVKVNFMEAYQKDKRIACQYGAKCYQKNPVHHQKYKHPPVKTQTPTAKKAPPKVQKRKINSKAFLPKAKIRKDESPATEDEHIKFPIPSLSSGDEENFSNDSEKDSSSSLEDEKSESEDEEKQVSIIYESPEKTSSECATSPQDDKKLEKFSKVASSPKQVKKYNEQKKLIKELFLLEMPEDFYQFYEFCCSLTSGAPGSALKTVGLELVGPFDVLLGKIKTWSQGDEEKYLTHWRYFSDPPEFQTILKGNDKEGLHFGYWRDEDNKLPVFVAKNSANIDGKIVTVAETLFGAVLDYTEERRRKASPFETASFALLSRKVKQFAKSNNISLELDSVNMKSRNRKSVTKTFHGAGIVVPYDKKTQIGYRSLAATDSEFKKILEKLDGRDDDVKKVHMSKIDEMVRLATIAADECDFGTPLELAHDLFSCGLPSVQKRALQLFKMSYSLLQRPIFSKIAQAHLKDRKKTVNLSVL